MAKVNKTCIVFGWFKSRDIEDTTLYSIFESSLFGKGCHYETAHDFIFSVKELYRKNSGEWAITNVVIG